MKLNEVSSPVNEAISTRRDLEWIEEQGGFTTTFQIEDRAYGISVQIEKESGFSFLRGDFHAIIDGKISHLLTGVFADRFKVIGIVANGIKERFPDQDGYYFVAKPAVDQEGFESRVKTYRRIMDRLRVELSLLHRTEVNPTETIFYLARTPEAMQVMTGEQNAAT